MKSSLSLLAFCLAFLAPTMGQEDDLWSHLKSDTASEVHVRRIDQQALSAYHDQSDFNYLSVPKDQETLWEKLKRWFYDHFIRPLSDGGTGDIFDGLILLLAIAGVAIMFYFIFRGRNRSALSSRDLTWGEVYSNPSEIAEEHFSERILEAEREEDYNTAIKYLYLWTIRQMDIKNFIHYRPEYTNRQVINRISDEEVKLLFKQIAAHFEFVWYGHFRLKEADYMELKNFVDKSKLA